MMMTARELEATTADQLGRCEGCGDLVAEIELTELDRLLLCSDCHSASNINDK